ncbi:MAG TPA: hypothetical protein VKB75_06635 [Jatrophihabitans sp.]|nr:hypothetical protein [Jatrophihabitans sp.]
MQLLRELTDAYARLPVRRVAVVANAPLDPSAERAALVDSCDLVFRVNGFALDTPDRPPAVGQRADVVVFNRGVRPTRWLFQDYRDRLYLLVEPGRMHWEPETIPDWWPPDLGMVAVPNRDVTIPLSDALGIDSFQTPHWATTGTMATWLAKQLYPAAELHLAGVSFIDNPDQTSWEHAVGEPCPISAEHLLSRESDLLRQWVATGEITLHR